MKDAPRSGRPQDSGSESGSSAELLPQVYDELRRLARARIAREPAGLTLQPTALVHEAYLRLAGDGSDRRWDRRGHFFAAAAIAMRRILVERARHYRRIKHGGEQQRVELDSESPALAPALPDVIAIDQALTRLEQIDPTKAQVVLLRYFAGLTIEETAAAMDLSPATVKNEWAFARAWLHDVLSRDKASPDSDRVVNPEVRDRPRRSSWRSLECPPMNARRYSMSAAAVTSSSRREVERLLDGLNVPDSFLASPHTPPAVGEDGIPQPAGAIVGDFVVVRQIGAGGTGVVYLAHQQHPSRVVALKMLRREFVASTVQRRFAIEAELLAQLHHPGIAQIYAAHPGDASTPPYIAMELVNGPPLTEFADSRELSVRDRVSLLARACDAVQHAHQRGIIHRDLKPGNILVRRRRPAQGARLRRRAHGRRGRAADHDQDADRSARRDAGLHEPRAGRSARRERSTRARTSTRSASSSFGCSPARLPFGHDDPPLPELARRIVSDDPPRLGTIDPALRGDLEVIVSRALAKEKERRYASAASLATDLRRFLAGQPIAASADSAWYTVRRKLGRYRLALGLSAAAVVALAGLAIYASLERARADRVSVQVQNQLATSTIDRGRLLSLTGNLPVAEELIWRELFRQPDSRHAQWTLWDVYSREPSLWASIVHDTGTQNVRFSPDSRLLMTAGRLDGLIRLIDVDSRQVLRTLSPEPLSGIATRALYAGRNADRFGQRGRFDPRLGCHDRRIASGDPAGRAWARGSRDRRRRYPGRHGCRGPRAGMVAGHGTARRGPLGPRGEGHHGGRQPDRHIGGGWQRRRNGHGHGRCPWIAAVALHAHDGQVNSLAIDPQGRIVASGGADGFLQLWSADRGELQRTINTENGRVRNLAFTADGATLAARGPVASAHLGFEASVESAAQLRRVRGRHRRALGADGRVLATCHGSSGQVRFWDLAADARTDHWPAIAAQSPASRWAAMLDRS